MQHQTRTLAFTFTLLSGLCVSTAVAQDNAGARTPTALSIGAQSLHLQPGDDVIMRDAIEHPIVFTQTKGEREFRGELIVHARAGKRASAEARIAPLTLRQSAFVPERVIQVPQGMSEGQLAAMLMATGDYAFVEPNWTLFPAIIPNDAQFSSSWQHTRIQSADAWDLTTGGNEVVVAICDSGVDTDHPDLQNLLVSGYNAASSISQTNGGSVEDVNGHGTFVSGCAAAQGNNGIGVVGAGWNFPIMPVRVSNNSDGTASSFAILEGARWAAENGAKIINVSFSGGTSSSNQSTARYLKEQGALMFWAAGNDSAFIEPVRPDYVIVGSTTSSDNRSGFSNFGPAVDVAAPGSSVRSTQRGGGYGNSSGTSFASPIAAGVGAMIFSVNPDFIPDDVQDILYNSVDDLGPTGRDDSFGRGRVNTFKGVQNAMNYVRPTVLPVSSVFEDGSWTELFSISSGSPSLLSLPQAPQGASVLALGQGDAIESVRLAGRTLYDDSMISFAARAQGLEAGDALLVQYLQNPEVAGIDSWATITQIDNRGLVNNEFIRFNIPLSFDIQWHGVQLRFVAVGDDADDRWMLDDLSIDILPPASAPLDENFESNQINPVAWNIDTNTQPTFNSGTFAAALGDNATLQSFDLPMLQFGIVQPFLTFDAWADAASDINDTMSVEVFTVAGTWELLTTLNGEDLGTSPQPIELNMPVYTWALNTQKVRFKTNTNGLFYLDNVYLGTEAPSSACSDADLAEPLGQLDFFDVSAFLTAFNSGQPSADFNNDTKFDFFDVSGFLTLFNAGCP